MIIENSAEFIEPRRGDIEKHSIIPSGFLICYYYIFYNHVSLSGLL